MDKLGQREEFCWNYVLSWVRKDGISEWMAPLLGLPGTYPAMNLLCPQKPSSLGTPGPFAILSEVGDDISWLEEEVLGVWEWREDGNSSRGWGPGTHAPGAEPRQSPTFSRAGEKAERWLLIAVFQFLNKTISPGRTSLATKAHGRKKSNSCPKRNEVEP